MQPGSVYCIPNAPYQNGDLWVEVTLNNTVKILSPAVEFWSFKEFTTEEFLAIFKEAK